MPNHAIDSNPPTAHFHITEHGSDWLWAAFAFISATLLATLGLHFVRPRGTRLFHQAAVVVLATASLAYFCMASDLGSTPIVTELRGDGATRQIWYVRYIQWFITFPLLLLSVLLCTGLALSDILITIFMGEFLVVSGLVGALVQSTYKWGFFVFGVFALFYIWYVLLAQATMTTFPAGGAFRGAYIQVAGFLSFMLITYPICWACAEGSNTISPTSEMIWYGILDILTGPIFLLFFLFRLNSVDYDSFGFQSGKYTDTVAPVRATKEQEAGAV